MSLLLSAHQWNKIESLTSEEGLSDGSVYAILRDHTGFVWLATTVGVDRYDGTHIVNIPFGEGSDVSEGNPVTALRENADGTLSVLTATSTWKLDCRQLTLQRLQENDLRVPSLKESPLGIADNETWRTEKGQFRFSNSIVDLIDETGVLWRCYKFFGVDYTRFSTHVFHAYNLPGGYSSEGIQVRSFLRDGSRMLLGTREGLVVVDGLDGSVRKIESKELGSPVITQILRIGSHYYIATVGGGIRVLQASTLQPVTTLLNGVAVYQLHNDGRYLWACTSVGLGKVPLLVSPSPWEGRGGVVGKAEGRLFTTDNSQLPDNEVICMYFDEQGNGLISTLNGICRYSAAKDALSVRDIPDGLRSLGFLRSITKCSGETLLLVPNQGSPAVYDLATGKVRAFFDNPRQADAKAVLANRSFLQILPVTPAASGKSQPQRFILVMADGLAVLDGEHLRLFGHLDGLDNHEMQARSAVIDGQGHFWAATNGGLVCADLKDMFRGNYPHIPVLLQDIQTDHWFSDVEVNGVMMDSVLTLSRHDNAFTLSFSPLVMTNTKDLKFRYRLEGHDHAWQLAGHDRRIAYRDLPPGTYTLRIEAIGRPEIGLQLRVSVPLTNTAIMLIITFLLLILLLAHVIYCRLNKKEYFWQRFIPKPEKYQKSRMDKAEGEQLSRRLTKLMEEEKPYLRPDLQMADLAQALGCSTHTLSQLFTQFINRNYYDFIAEYRIKEFMLRAADPAYSKYTITALSELCGFRSRNPFLVAFKKLTGMSPREWMKQKETL